jgi:hypothetical protein
MPKYTSPVFNPVFTVLSLPGWNVIGKISRVRLVVDTLPREEDAVGRDRQN